MKRLRATLAATLVFAFTVVAAAADDRPSPPPVEMTVGSPPMSADDAGTAGDGNWEINTSVNGDAAHRQRSYELPRLDANYGIGDRLQLKFEIPWVVGDDHSVRTHGPGNASFGLKIRFYDSPDGRLSLATYPQTDFHFPGVRSAEQGGTGEATSWLVPLIATRELESFSLTANASVGKTAGDSRIHRSAVLGAGRRLTTTTALLSEVSTDDPGTADRRATARIGVRHQWSTSTILFASIATDIMAGDGTRHRSLLLGFQYLIPKRD